MKNVSFAAVAIATALFSSSVFADEAKKENQDNIKDVTICFIKSAQTPNVLEKIHAQIQTEDGSGLLIQGARSGAQETETSLTVTYSGQIGNASGPDREADTVISFKKVDNKLKFESITVSNQKTLSSAFTLNLDNVQVSSEKTKLIAARVLAQSQGQASVHACASSQMTLVNGLGI